MFNIHDKIFDLSTLSSKTNKEILEETRILRKQKDAALKIESFYMMCNNKHFSLRMRQIRYLQIMVAQKFWKDPRKECLDKLIENIHIPSDIQQSAFRCGYLLPLVYPKPTSLYNAMLNIKDERLSLMSKQVFQYIWISGDCFPFLEFMTHLKAKDTHAFGINVMQYYDIKDLFKQIVVKRLSPSEKLAKLEGLFHLCLFCPLEQQHQYFLMLKPLLESLKNMVPLFLLSDSVSVQSYHKYFYKVKPSLLKSTLESTFNIRSYKDMVTIFLELELDKSRQYLFNIFYFLKLYLLHSLDPVIAVELESIRYFSLFIFHFLHLPKCLEMDEEREDYDVAILPILREFIVLMRFTILRLQADSDYLQWQIPCHWTSKMKSDLQECKDEIEQTGQSLNTLYTKYTEDTVVLHLLNNPFYYTFQDRCIMFHHAFPSFRTSFAHPQDVERANILNSLFQIDFTTRFSIRFANSDFIEFGVDGGGLYNEFFSLILKAVVEEYFIIKDDVCVINSNQNVAHFYQIGMLFARCLCDDIVIPFKLNTWIFASILGANKSINDVYYYDKEIYGQLMQILTKPIQSMDLFDTSINDDNKFTEVHKLAMRWLNQDSRAIAYLIQGIRRIIPVLWFDPYELSLLFHGKPTIDVNDMVQSFVLQNYIASDKTIVDLLRILDEFDQVQLSNFFRFVTGRERPPVLGCGSLEPKIGILKTNEIEHMPSSSTCMNLLKLPNYQDYYKLKRKLEYCIEEGVGFGME
eukprot:NODE_389_length_8228_cov_1.280600.p2 type:complete len:747 gc:universal NODE_389_length_8228_cov_1.280600:5029-7269(+)